MEYNIYCDESCHLEHDGIDVMVLGGVFCNKDIVGKINADIRNLKTRHGFSEKSELKWTNIAKSNIDMYKELIDLFFDEPLHFRAYIATCKTQLNNKAFNQTYNDWYYKMYYKMLEYIVSRFLYGNSTASLFIDIKDTVGTKKIAKLKHYLNKHARREVITNAQLVRSHQVPLVQLADVLIGALSYNARDLKTSSAKLEIIDYISVRLNADLSAQRCSSKKFNWFKWKPSGGRHA